MFQTELIPPVVGNKTSVRFGMRWSQLSGYASFGVQLHSMMLYTLLLYKLYELLDMKHINSLKKSWIVLNNQVIQASLGLTMISKPSLSSRILTSAVSPIFSCPLMIWSARPLPISLVMSRFRGRAPNLGS